MITLLRHVTSEFDNTLSETERIFPLQNAECDSRRTMTTTVVAGTVSCSGRTRAYDR